VQTRKIQPVPIILVGEDFWRPLEGFIKEQMLGRGTIDAEDLNLFIITDNEDKIIEAIRAVPVRVGLEYSADL
jgi:predicted Rossmann-fold nucleotide-binding protein